ncbi:MAG TPA: hypothetical protein EYG11_23675 [Candidatus Latescibacteria bacterium]|nr:hypothetical protein [Candidatus Handelsmanbacteria bacterium]HIL11698.1 hypothetical protein [Candidatus Latescibacterota bacterium]
MRTKNKSIGFIYNGRVSAMRFAVLLFAYQFFTSAGHAQSPTFHWSFDAMKDSAFAATEADAPLVMLRQSTTIEGIENQAVRLSRLDALRGETVPDLVSDGIFSIQFWLKTEWASRRYDHGDVLNFATPDSTRSWTWRVGFPSTWDQVMPPAPWPLTLRIGGDFSTAELAVYIEPWQWTHVAFVGDGQQISVYRNGGLIGTVDLPEEGLPPIETTTGALQVNGSHNFSVPVEKGRTGVWENDLRIDELYLADEPQIPSITFPTELQPGPPVTQLRVQLNELEEADRRDRFAVEALLNRMEQIDRGADTRALRQELLQRAHQAIEALAVGRRPLSTQRGHLRLAYWSPLDQTAQPYEVYVPASWNGKEPTALVVALHGSTEDETVYFERYSIEEQAEKHGWIVVTPYGRGQRAYRDAGGRDVIDVIDRVSRQWSVDPDRVYVTGHSMGGMGCVSLVRDYPDVFAAAAPVASYAESEWIDQLKETPFLWIVGEKDGDWATNTVKNMMEAAQKVGAPHTSKVLTGYDHGGFLGLKWPTVVEVTLPDVFAFFANHRN